MKINPDKPVRTRDGQEVTLLSSKGHPDRPLVGYVEKGNSPYSWGSDGKYFSASDVESPFDLIQTTEFWINVYEHGGMGPTCFGFPSLERAKAADKGYCIGRFKAVYEGGFSDV